MRPRFKNKQQGIIPAILALIIGLVCIIILVLVLALIVYFNHIIAGLIGGGDQPNGNCNVGCGFDTSKIDYYIKGKQPDIADAESEEAKDFAVNILHVEPSQITIFDKGVVENMIRAEVAAQWSQLKTEQQHGATQADAQQAILAYQEHESSAFQQFKKEGNRLVPSLTRDSSGVCTNILSITRDKWAGNKRKEIAIMWDIKYDIYLGVQENISNFINKASGSGKERWKNALGITFWPGDPSRYWRQGSAEAAWNKYKNEVAYNCRTSSCAAETGFNNVPFFSQCDSDWADYPYTHPSKPNANICSSGCGPTSVAMVLAKYGKKVNPIDTAKWSKEHGKRVSEGTSWDLFCSIAEANGLKCRETGQSWNDILNALNQGKPIVASMRDHGFCSSSGCGHFIVLAGVNKDGTISINDPYPKSRCTPKDTPQCGRVPSAPQSKVMAGLASSWLIEP